MSAGLDLLLMMLLRSRVKGWCSCTPSDRGNFVEIKRWEWTKHQARTINRIRQQKHWESTEVSNKDSRGPMRQLRKEDGENMAGAGNSGRIRWWATRLTTAWTAILRFMTMSGHYVLCCSRMTTVTGLATDGQTGEQRVGAASLICTTQRWQIMHRYTATS